MEVRFRILTMTTPQASTTHTHSDHERLVAGTLALLPARREGLEHVRTRPAKRPVRNDYVPPADASTHRQLVIEIDDAHEGALISAQSRARIMSCAQKLGVRPFDASLMIALAQDRARRGESLEGIPTMLSAGTDTDSGSAPTMPWLAVWLAVAALGVLLAQLAAGWMMG